MTRSMMRKQGVLEDIQEAETIEELDALSINLDEYAQDTEVLQALDAKRETFKTPEQVLDITKEQLLQTLAALTAQLEELKQTRQTPAKTSPLAQPRLGKKYQIISTEVTWCNTPQVLVIADVLKAMVDATSETRFDEDDILYNLEQNATALRTRQPVRKIWDFYKGRMRDAGMIKVG
jgi:hypothetical protein